MTSRTEITSRCAKAYVKARKKQNGQVLDEVVSVTDWSRDNARLVAAACRPGSGRQVAKKPRKRRSGKCAYDAVKVLHMMWAASDGQCGKYLAVSMRTQLDGLERHRELVFGVDRYSMAVRDELLSMSAATIEEVPGPGQGARRYPWGVGEETLAAAALVGHDPQGRGRGGGRAGVLRGRHRRALTAHAEERVRPDGEPDGRAHRLGVHPHGAQQRADPHPGNAQNRRGGGSVRGDRVGRRQRHRVSEQGGHRLGR